LIVIRLKIDGTDYLLLLHAFIDHLITLVHAPSASSDHRHER
jgi:hypothetical protein